MDQPQLAHREKWLQDNVTKYILAGLYEKVEYYQRCWVEGYYQEKTADETTMHNMKNMGAAQEILELIKDIEHIADSEPEKETEGDENV